MGVETNLLVSLKVGNGDTIKSTSQSAACGTEILIAERLSSAVESVLPH